MTKPLLRVPDDEQAAAAHTEHVFPECAGRIAAAIVTYRPDLPVLRGLIQRIRPQVDTLWIFNNGAPDELDALDALGANIEIIQLGRNLGVGEALARAARLAHRTGHEFLLTLDQDSIPAPNMVGRLCHAYHRLIRQGIRVGALGPEQIDRRSGHRAPFVAPITGWCPVRKKGFPEPGEVMEVDHLITSGLFAPVSAYEMVGPPRADLFIDYVDIEWSLRLRYHGFRLFAVEGARLYHSIGDAYTHFRGRQISVHSPLRHYYLMRNGTFLLGLPAIPLAWKLSDTLQLMKKAVFFTLFLPKRRERLRMMVKGVADGLRGRLGAFGERA